jgi:hypothetical protein
MNKIIALLGSLTLLSLPLPQLSALAQSPSNNIIRDNSNIYDSDRLKFVIQTCNRKQEDIICQGTIASKVTDRAIEFNLSNIKLIDFEGNEYYPNSLRLANRSIDSNSLKTELVVNINVKTTIVFPKVPPSVNKIALLNIPLELEQDNAIAKFRNLSILSTNSIDKNQPKSSSTAVKPTVKTNNDANLICPETSKILYRAASKDNLLFICGAKNPAYFVTQSKDGTQGMTLRLRSYDKKSFSADNGATNYAIAGVRFTITRNGKVVSQEKISILQPLTGSTATNPTPTARSSATNSNRVTKKSENSNTQPVKLRSVTRNEKKTLPSLKSKPKKTSD